MKKTSQAAPRIGLVLGAGGITGFAYHSGALSALTRVTGWDPRTADIIVGTSAGSGFGSMLRGGVPVEEVLAHLLAAPSDPETMARLRVLSGRELNSPSWFWFGPGSPRLLAKELRKPWKLRPSRVLTALAPNGRISTEFLGDRARELHGLDWPQKTFWACAVRLRDGERITFGRSSTTVEAITTDVGTAIEASSAIPGFFQPVWIQNERYVDGAVHSPTNADLLLEKDLDLVVIVSPMSGDCGASLRSLDAITRLPSAAALNREVQQLRQSGQSVLVVEPGPNEIRTMGPINMDPTRIVPTVLQSSASTFQHLNSSKNTVALELLKQAAQRTPSPPTVPYPVGVVRRVP